MGQIKARQVTPEQWDLFGDRGLDTSAIPDNRQKFDPEALSNQEIIHGIPQASLSNVDALCKQVITRCLADEAVPALEALWQRFRGFGIVTPQPEQILALKTLTEIGTPLAQGVIQKIISATDLPSALLPHALQAATTSQLNLPLRQIVPWLDHEIPMVRAFAFGLIQRARPPADILEVGLSDPDPSVRRATLISMGNLGYVQARDGLLAELTKNPNSQIIYALTTIEDEAIITQLGRCALEYPDLKTIITEELSVIDDPRAQKIVDRINAQN